MKSLITSLSLALAAATFAMSANAASDASTPVKQQTKMATCNKDAVGKKGDERKSFMKQCLSARKADVGASTEVAATDLTKACKAKAKGMRGNARKDFLAECASKPA